MTRPSMEDSYIVMVSILVYALIGAFWPGQAHSGALSTTLACITHAVLYNVMAYNFATYCKNPHFLQTPLALSGLLLIIYLGVPFLKYYGEARYVELDVALHYRIFGLLVICAAIYLILKLYAHKWIHFHLKAQAIQRSVGPLFVPLMYSIFGVTTFYLITGSVLTGNSLGVAQITLIVSGYYISLYYFALFGATQRVFLNELLFLSGGLAITYFSGQRFALLLSVFMLVFARISRVQSQRKRRSLVLMSMLAAPLALIIALGPLTELTKTRYGGVSLLFELQRTDFSDFVGAASMADYKASAVTGLHTSFLWALPGRFIDKEKLDWSMEPFYKNNGWRSSNYREGYTRFNIDYIDSIFSSGAMVGGFLGALIFALGWYGVHILIISQLRKTLLLSFYLASIPSLLNIEIAFWTIVPTIRNWIFLSLILFCAIQAVVWLRGRRGRSSDRRLVKGTGSLG